MVKVIIFLVVLLNLGFVVLLGAEFCMWIGRDRGQSKAITQEGMDRGKRAEWLDTIINHQYTP